MNPSLIITPNAVDEGKLFSIVPTDGSGDLDVVRATSATRVDENGLIEIPRTNLLRYSDEFGGVNWNETYSNIISNSILAPDGTLTADTWKANGDPATHNLYQFASLTSEVTYTFSVFVKKNTNNFIQLASSTNGLGNTFYINFDIENEVIGDIGAGVIKAGIEDFGNGWYRLSATGVAQTTSSQPMVFILIDSLTASRNQSNSLDTSVYLWGAQLEQGVTATEYIPTTDSIRTSFAGITQDGGSASNIARLDYSNGSCPSILVEPQRTNLVLYSNDFSNSYWTKQDVTVTANSTTSPDGTLNATTYTSLQDGTTLISENVTVSGTQYTFSCYAKYLNNTWLRLAGQGTAFSGWFNIQNGTLGTTSSATSSIEALADGWYRCSITYTADSGRGVALFIPTNDDSTLEATNKSAYIWGTQLEEGSNATSYIPTTTSSVTRNTDVISKSNVYTENLITSNGGSWFVELDNNIEITRQSVGGGFYLKDIDISNTLGTGIMIRNSSSAEQRVSISRVINDVGSTLFQTTTDYVKILIKWNGTTMDIFVNGVKVVDATSFTPTVFNYLTASPNRTLEIKNSFLFPMPITDEQAILLTTL